MPPSSYGRNFLTILAVFDLLNQTNTSRCLANAIVAPVKQAIARPTSVIFAQFFLRARAKRTTPAIYRRHVFHRRRKGRTLNRVFRPPSSPPAGTGIPILVPGYHRTPPSRSRLSWWRARPLACSGRTFCPACSYCSCSRN